MDLDDEEEEEVTFLLRLRPTPSPPASRRRKSSIGSTRPMSGSGWDVVVERQGNTPPPHRRASVESRPTSGSSWDVTSQSPVVPGAQPQRRTSVDSRPTSGTSWDLMSQPPVVPSAPPQCKTNVKCRPTSGTAWDTTSNTSASQSSPPSAEVPCPWVCPIPQHAWTAPYGPLFSNVSWTQPFPAPSQRGLNYRHFGPSTVVPQTFSLQEDYKHHFEAPDMFFHPLSVDNSICQHPDNLPLHPQPHNPTHTYQHHSNVSKDLPQRLTSAEMGIGPTGNLAHKISCDVESANSCETERNLASFKSVSLSHGSLPAISNQNMPSDNLSTLNEGFVAVKNRIRSGTLKEPSINQKVSVNCQNSNFANSFRRYSVPSATFARASNMDQVQRCEVAEESRQDTSNCPPALPPRPPKPARFHRGDRQRSQQIQEATTLPQVNADVEERLRRLEADKDSLQLQVAVLTEQIEVQTDKISDLEKLLDEKKSQLTNTEDVLQREMLSRSSLETQKLELLSAMSELKLQQAALERDNLELRDRLGEERRRNKPPVIPRSTLLATSTPVSSQQASQLLGGVSPSPSPVSSLSEGSPRRLGNHPNSMEDFKDIPAPRTPPANYRRKVEHYGSLPRQRVTTNGMAVSPMDGISPVANAAGMRKGVAFGKGLVSSFLPFQHPLHQASRLKVSGQDKSFSTPNLAETERVVIEDVVASPSTDVVTEEEVDETTGSLGLSPQPSPSFQVGKNKGIKKIFGRMKRSGSGNLDDLPGEGEFSRGGIRATAGPRLGWTNQPVIKPRPDRPFAEWDSEAICGWMQELGLDCYANDAKRWVKTGTHLLQASNHELEKELGIKHPIHRKKLHLALLSQQGTVATLDPHLIPAGELDTAWVLRWLDDVGLPQYKETFLAARVDGRLLHRLTMDELAVLHVTSHLHVASLRRGIQVLRNNKFEPNCLKRRSLPDDPQQPTAQDVALWTNHRVMEWLRIVDLAEYAPNLRGSGVHGGLMVHEPRFTAELLASLLSIPPSKTLLRRHLNTHFKELLGRECIQEKREAEATLGYVPLSATTKVKVTKKSQFTLKRKKSKSELDFGDLVCPLDPNKSGETLPHGDGMTQMGPQDPKVVVVSRETAISSEVVRKQCARHHCQDHSVIWVNSICPLSVSHVRNEFYAFV
ncbi:liprin-beta-1 isoform X8 [Cryptotermes secundus]|uniref:liprin-beta-1 isoform X8 n=1 Tax=Cryptotermes secundus TaxID=105785 RepID=UPI001454D7F7|nr:liprin-beta-1 isoform X8 [Cryptotermes secundus]